MMRILLAIDESPYSEPRWIVPGYRCWRADTS
jgi:hypothetical protein